MADEFMRYIFRNSLLKPSELVINPKIANTTITSKIVEEVNKSAQQRAKERKVGRPRPMYCELHEALVLDAPQKHFIPLADHNHETGVYRGWICRTCNTQLLPEIDRLKRLELTAEDIKSFLHFVVDYVFSDGANVKQLFDKEERR